MRSVLWLGILLCMSTVSATDCNSNDKIGETTFFDGFMNIRGAHERDRNAYAFGPNNTSIVLLNPVLRFGNCFLDAECYYGRQVKYAGFLTSFRHISRYINDVHEFNVAYRENPRLLNNSKKAAENAVDKPHFYRAHTRVVYMDKARNLKVVAGDTRVRNLIGFQTGLSGVGVSIFHQGASERTVAPNRPIFITKLSKTEVRLGNEILSIKILPPGIYDLEAFGEEVKIPGTTIKIGDQIGTSEKFNVEYFNGYGLTPKGEHNYDMTVVCGHKWNIDDPYRIRYKKKPKLSTNWLYGLTDNVTFGVGMQAYEKAITFDHIWIINTPMGKIAPNIGYSYDAHMSEHHAIGAGLYYELPANDMGVHFEIQATALAKGYSNMGCNEEINELSKEYILRCFGGNPHLNSFLPQQNESSVRKIVCRLYSDPICGITPSFIFSGAWTSRTQRMREYTIAFTRTFFNCCTLTVSGGLTYDDPSKGVNQKSPDRRFIAACCVNFSPEWSVKTTYTHYDDELYRSYGMVSYKPEAIHGLEISTEVVRKPGVSNPLFTVKYDNKYFNVKVEQNIVNTYDDINAKTRNGHRNGQRFLFGTSICKDGIRAARSADEVYEGFARL